MRYAPRTETLSFPPDVTRLVVLGDPHGDLAGLEAVVAREGREGVAWVSVGDNVGYADGPASSLLCARLRALGAASVFGNHEAWMSDAGALAIVEGGRRMSSSLTGEALEWSRGLPERLRLRFEAAPSLTVSVRHTIGSGWDYVSAENVHLLAGDERSGVVFVGHSHAARIFRVGPRETLPEVRLGLQGEETREIALGEPDTVHVVDAGSLARPGYYPEPGHFQFATYATLDLGTGKLAIHALRKAEPASPE